MSGFAVVLKSKGVGIALGVWLLWGAVVQGAEGQDYQRMAQDLLILRDGHAAAEVIFEGLSHDGGSREMWELYFRALGQDGDESRLLAGWRDFRGRFPEEEHRVALEEVCWTVLRAGMRSSSAAMRLYALIGAAMNADRRGVEVILQGLSDGSTVVRLVAAEMAAMYRDKVIIEALIRLLEREHHPEVRVALIGTLGQQKAVQARPLLLASLQKREGSGQEVAALVAALDQLTDSVSRDDLDLLVNSRRAGLRLLACHLVATRECTDLLEVLSPLARDSHPTVLSGFYEVCGLLRPEKIGDATVRDVVQPGLRNSDPQVAATAAWALAVLGDERGKEYLGSRLGKGIPRVQRVFAAAAAALGADGVDLMWEGLSQARDPYVKLSLALGLVAFNERVEECCAVLHQLMRNNRDLWRRRNWGLVLGGIEPAQHSIGLGMAPFLETTDQVTRLELLSLLAVKGYAQALDGVREFLRNSHWGVGAVAAAVLLSEGDEEALDVVRYCLQDSDSRVRTQAALVLALWGRDREAVGELEKIYSEADRGIKERILESVGHVGDDKSLPFLCDALNEPFQGLRLVAASSILRTLFL